MNESMPSSISAALSDAQRVIKEAEARAAQIINEAKEEYIEAHKLGYEAGLIDGREEAIRRGVRLLEDSAELNDSLIREAAQLAIAIASKVVGEQVKIELATVRKIALQALRSLPFSAGARIVCHPDDQKVLELALQDVERVAGGPVSLEVDETITRGGCLIKTLEGEADATIEAMIGVISLHLGVSGYDAQLTNSETET